jgi:preprotein translocase subunit YajC
VKDFLPFVIFVVVVLGLLGFSARARRRQAAVATERAAQITVGREVMTSSGLYGTVVARNPDDSVILAIAPGVEVKWALAALRDVDTLPAQYRESGPYNASATPTQDQQPDHSRDGGPGAGA